MNNQAGSITLVLLIAITLTSISSVLALQSSLSLNKQINLAKLFNKAKEIAVLESDLKFATITAGINLSSLPVTETKNHSYLNHLFKSSQATAAITIINFALNGYSLVSSYRTQLIELTTNTQSSMVKSNNLIGGLGCLSLTKGQLTNQIESFYPLDLDHDSIIDANYQFDSSNGEIKNIESAAQSLIDLALDTDQSFSRPTFAIFEFGINTKLGLVFVVQNISSATQTANNTLYIIFDNGLFNSQIELPINPNDLIDLNTNPNFFVSDPGYFLALEQGQLISTAITIFDQQVIFVTQLPETDANTGLTNYSNKLITINFSKDSPIVPNIQTVADSSDLLELELNTQNHQLITLNSQFGSLVSLPGECRLLYSYEN